MSDWKELSLQEHELNYILKELLKRETEDNRKILRNWEKTFKDSNGGQSTKSYTKEEFHEYLKDKDLDDLEAKV